jgi:chromosome segregation ATPase
MLIKASDISEHMPEWERKAGPTIGASIESAETCQAAIAKQTELLVSLSKTPLQIDELSKAVAELESNTAVDLTDLHTKFNATAEQLKTLVSNIETGTAATVALSEALSAVSSVQESIQSPTGRIADVELKQSQQGVDLSEVKSNQEAMWNAIHSLQTADATRASDINALQTADATRAGTIGEVQSAIDVLQNCMIMDAPVTNADEDYDSEEEKKPSASA